jgi:hypothetical protein
MLCTMHRTRWVGSLLLGAALALAGPQLAAAARAPLQHSGTVFVDGGALRASDESYGVQARPGVGGWGGKTLKVQGCAPRETWVGPPKARRGATTSCVVHRTQVPAAVDSQPISSEAFCRRVDEGGALVLAQGRPQAVQERATLRASLVILTRGSGNGSSGGGASSGGSAGSVRLALALGPEAQEGATAGGRELVAGEDAAAAARAVAGWPRAGGIDAALPLASLAEPGQTGFDRVVISRGQGNRSGDLLVVCVRSLRVG